MQKKYEVCMKHLIGKNACPECFDEKLCVLRDKIKGLAKDPWYDSSDVMYDKGVVSGLNKAAELVDEVLKE